MTELNTPLPRFLSGVEGGRRVKKTENISLKELILLQNLLVP